jgi:hypothetical protein
MIGSSGSACSWHGASTEQLSRSARSSAGTALPRPPEHYRCVRSLLRAISAALRDETHAIEVMLLTERPYNRYIEPGARLAGQESEPSDARGCTSV